MQRHTRPTLFLRCHVDAGGAPARTSPCFSAAQGPSSGVARDASCVFGTGAGWHRALLVFRLEAEHGFLVVDQEVDAGYMGARGESFWRHRMLELQLGKRGTERRESEHVG